MRVQAKRMKNSFKCEKTHSLLHEYILSGIIKCPVYSSPMYGVVNRKKKVLTNSTLICGIILVRTEKRCQDTYVTTKSISGSMRSIQRLYSL